MKDTSSLPSSGTLYLTNTGIFVPNIPPVLIQGMNTGSDPATMGSEQSWPSLYACGVNVAVKFMDEAIENELRIYSVDFLAINTTCAGVDVV